MTSIASPAEEQPTEARSRRLSGFASWPAARRNHWLLVGVAVCFAGYVLVAVGLRYPYTTDEAIYFSQVNPQVPDYTWVAWRAWGVPLVVAPAALLDLSLTGVRFYLVVVASAGIFLAFQPWLTVSRHPVAPVAAALFGGTSAAAYNGSLALPNLYSALAAVAATGYFMNCRRGGDNYRRSLLGLAVAVAFAALVRPSDSVWLVLPLFLVWLGLSAWRRWEVFAALAVGQIVGWAPWLVESFVRFGDPFNRLHLSSASLGGTHLYPDAAMLRLYLRLWNTGNPQAVSLNVPPEFRGGAATLANVQLAPSGALAVIWWIALACALVAAVAGAALTRRTARDGLAVVLVPLAVGVSVAFPYLFMMRYGQLRFLLPAIGLLAVPVAAGVLQIARLRRAPLRVLGPAVAAILALALIGVQVAATGPYRETVERADASATELIRALRQAGVPQPCALFGEAPFNVAYQMKCETAERFRQPGIGEPAAVTSARGRGLSVAVVLRRPAPAGTFLDRWRLATGGGQPGRWHVYLAPA
ncbi:hypothetical protein ACN27G_31905 [Plantactinospora sp. WMMB334]|uniref:hypothetical protein n=1 Tax=Plantactinospora sp. WMMB334 TaxID=3404119 RepID=UPI003B95DB74